MSVQGTREMQRNRMARQSWNYVNQNDPLYPELINAKRTNIFGEPLSVKEVTDNLKKENKDIKPKLAEKEDC